MSDPAEPPVEAIPTADEARRALDRAALAIGPLDEAAMRAAAAHQDALTKPAGSLGRLEAIAIRLAGIRGLSAPPVDRRAIVIAAADHGVTRQGVSAYPSEVTGQMVANFLAGGAAISVLAGASGARLTILDVGVAAPRPIVPPEASARYLDRRIRAGTADLTTGPAMTRDEALRSIGVGLAVADALARDGVDLLGVGEMGIGNTTSASALTAALTGTAPAEVTGRGTGLDPVGLARKIAVVGSAIARHRPDPRDPIGALAAVGGLEMGALAGLLIGAAAARVPVVLDGFITAAAALVAARLAPGLPPRLLAGHRSVEPGHAVILDDLGLEPLLDLDLRLGEGSGAALAMDLVVSAARLRDGMATFAAADVSGPA